MTNKMTRRTFILSALVSGILLYAGGWWNFRVRKGDISDIVVTLVRKKLDYLQLDEAGLEKFANDFAQTTNPILTLRLSWMGMFSPLYAHTHLLDSTNAVDVFGEEVLLDGNSHTVIGVMPPGFSLPRETDVWTPLAVERAKDKRMSNNYCAIARLSPGVTLELAQANMVLPPAHLLTDLQLQLPLTRPQRGSGHADG